MTGIAASRMRGGPSPAALPHDTLTHVELTWVEKKIENWIRFGMHAHEQIAGFIYIGTAKDVKARLAVHNRGKGAKYTRPRLPVRVVWQEGPMSLTCALQREYQLKQLTRPQKQALIRGKLVVKRPR